MLRKIIAPPYIKELFKGKCSLRMLWRLSKVRNSLVDEDPTFYRESGQGCKKEKKSKLSI